MFSTFRSLAAQDGDVDGQMIWKRVLKAVKEIQREEPHDGEAVN